MYASALSYEGLDGGHAPAGIALMAGEARGLLDAWASSPGGILAPPHVPVVNASQADTPRPVTCVRA
jgi:hypothetical protein